MPLDVDPEVFAALVAKALTSKTTDLTSLLNISRPFICYWADNIRRRLPDIQIVSLLRLLSADIDTAIAAVNSWIKFIEETHTLEEEFTEIFIEVIRGLSYYPKRAAPEMVEYVVALNFKRRVKDLIKCHRRVKRHSHRLEAYQPPEPDWFLLKTLNNEPWAESLIFWLLRGYNIPAIASITNIKEDNIRNDVRKLCQAIQQSSIDRQFLAKHDQKAD